MTLILNKKRKLYDIKYKKDEIEANFKCKILTKKEVSDLIKKNTPIHWDSPDDNTPKTRFTEPTDMFQFVLDSFCESIVEWDVKDENNNIVECTTEAKIILYDNYPEVGNFITKEIKKIRENLQLEAEMLEKN